MAGLFGRGGGRRRGGWKFRLVIAIGLALFALFKFYWNTDKNEMTGENQRVALTEVQEIQLGLNAAPKLVQQYGGEVGDASDNDRLDKIGQKLVSDWERKIGKKSPYPFEFYLLNDREVINAFALPGGQVFITAALYQKLSSDDQLAGVIGHEIGHVFSRHGAEHMAKGKLTQGLVGAAATAGGDMSSAQMAQMVGKLINMRYGRKDELESDEWAVKLTMESGFDPYAMIEVMKILEAASGGKRSPEFMSSHPNPGNRIEKIEAFIEKQTKK